MAACHRNFLDYLKKYLTNFHLNSKKIILLYDRDYQDLAQKICAESDTTDFVMSCYEINIANLSDLEFDLISSNDFALIFFDVYKLYHQKTLLNHYKVVVPKFEKFVDKFIFMRDFQDQFADVFHYPLELIASLNQKIFTAATHTAQIEVAASNSGRLNISTKNGKWFNLNGFDYQYQLIPSEVFLSSPIINGEIHFTGILQSQIPIGIKFGHITKSDNVLIKVVDNKVVEISSTNSELNHELNKYLSFNEKNREIMEAGFGTNIGIKSLVGRSAPFEERYPGFHLGIGGQVKNSQHLDFVFDESIIYFDKKLIFSDQKYLI